jgi:hypothetical protein
MAASPIQSRIRFVNKSHHCHCTASPTQTAKRLHPFKVQQKTLHSLIGGRICSAVAIPDGAEMSASSSVNHMPSDAARTALFGVAKQQVTWLQATHH